MFLLRPLRKFSSSLAISMSPFPPSPEGAAPAEAGKNILVLSIRYILFDPDIPLPDSADAPEAELFHVREARP